MSMMSHDKRSDNSKSPAGASRPSAAKRRNQYVMGEQMTRTSMIADMTENVMVLSKLHESEHSPNNERDQGNRSMELSFNYNTEFAPSHIKQRLT